MPTRDYNRHLVSNTSPTRAQVGDEYYDPGSNKLYKLVAVNGTTTTWNEVLLTVPGPTFLANESSITSTYYPSLTQISSSGVTTSANNCSYNLYYTPLTGTLSSTIFTSLSDETQKTNIQPIQNSLDIVKNINGVTFNWKDSNLPSAGLLAQEVEKYLPELVTQAGDIKTLNYNGIIGVLVEAIKQLNSRIDELEGR